MRKSAWTYRYLAGIRPSRWTAAVMVAVAVLGGCEPGGEPAVEETPAEPTPKPVVAMETSKGLIRMELEPDLAPRSVENFLLHVRSKYYDGLTFYRVRAGFIIQGGELTPTMQRRVSPAAPIINEAENGLKNLRGTVAMARTGDPHSATSEFFINVVDNAGLDF